MSVSSLHVAFTGHRPDKIGGYGSEDAPVTIAVRAALAREISQLAAAHPDGVTFYSGMAQGVDTWAGESVIAARDGGLPVRLVAVVPFVGHHTRWPAAAQDRFFRLLRAADERVYVRGEVPVDRPVAHVRQWLFERNRWMVDHADLVIAVWDGSSGGTAHCVEYARRRGLRVVQLDPTMLVRLTPEAPAQLTSG